MPLDNIHEYMVDQYNLKVTCRTLSGREFVNLMRTDIPDQMDYFYSEVLVKAYDLEEAMEYSPDDFYDEDAEMIVDVFNLWVEGLAKKVKRS